MWNAFEKRARPILMVVEPAERRRKMFEEEFEEEFEEDNYCRGCGGDCPPGEILCYECQRS